MNSKMNNVINNSSDVHKLNLKKMCDLLCDEIFMKFESSKKIILNKNLLFINNFWSTFCFYAYVKRRLNIVFHSQTNEQTKRQNQILKHYLRIFCNYKQNNWIAFLFFATFVYNCAKHMLIEFVSFATMMNYISNFQWKFDIAKFDVQSTKKNHVVFKKKFELKQNLKKKKTNLTQTKTINKKNDIKNIRCKNQNHVINQKFKYQQIKKKFQINSQKIFWLQKKSRNKHIVWNYHFNDEFILCFIYFYWKNIMKTRQSTFFLKWNWSTIKKNEKKKIDVKNKKNSNI